MHGLRLGRKKKRAGVANSGEKKSTERKKEKGGESSKEISVEHSRSGKRG